MTSVIIPTTIGGFTFLTQLLPLLSKEACELIVIDNGSKDGSVNYLSNYESTVIIHKENKGFAKAINEGARIAKGEYLLLLNNDTVIKPGFIQEMENTFKEDVGIVGCLITQLGENKVQNCGIMFNKDYIPYELGRPSEYTGLIPFDDSRVNAIREVPAVTGACLMIKKAIFDSVGGLDEEYINGWEDNDLCLKVREKGYKIMYTGKTSIAHQLHGSANAGRFSHERQNRERYDSIWVNTGRAKNILGEFIQA